MKIKHFFTSSEGDVYTDQEIEIFSYEFNPDMYDGGCYNVIYLNGAVGYKFNQIGSGSFWEITD